MHAGRICINRVAQADLGSTPEEVVGPGRRDGQQAPLTPTSLKSYYFLRKQRSEDRELKKKNKKQYGIPRK
jgi:hypothetical protein